MSPGDERSRPGEEAAVSKVIAATGTSVTDASDKTVEAAALERARAHRVAMGRRACRHLHTYRPCRACQRERRAAQDQLRSMVAARPAEPPSTFFLTDEALRAEASRLFALGCSVADIERVLAIEPRSA